MDCRARRGHLLSCTHHKWHSSWQAPGQGCVSPSASTAPHPPPSFSWYETPSTILSCLYITDTALCVAAPSSVPPSPDTKYQQLPVGQVRLQHITGTSARPTATSQHGSLSECYLPAPPPPHAPAAVASFPYSTSSSTRQARTCLHIAKLYFSHSTAIDTSINRPAVEHVARTHNTL